MNNDTQKKVKKSTYQEELRTRVHAWWEETFITPGHVGSHEVSEPEIYQLVKDIALESFKNGVKVGQHRARPTSGKQLVAEEAA